jgi:hypothetical protein
MTLMVAEVVALRYYRALRDGAPYALLRDVGGRILNDEERHVPFHVARLRQGLGRLPWAVRVAVRRCVLRRGQRQRLRADHADRPEDRDSVEHQERLRPECAERPFGDVLRVRAPSEQGELLEAHWFLGQVGQQGHRAGHRDDYQVHQQVASFGCGNVFSGNTSKLSSAGFAINVTDQAKCGTNLNVVGAGNTVTGAKSGLSNIKVTG